MMESLLVGVQFQVPVPTRRVVKRGEAKELAHFPDMMHLRNGVSCATASRSRVALLYWLA